MGGICGANATTAGARPVEPHFKPLDPEPISAVRIEGIIEDRYLPGMPGRIIQAAYEELKRACLKEPALLHRYPIVSETLIQARAVVVGIEAFLIACQIRNGRLDFCEIDVIDSGHRRPDFAGTIQ